MTAVAFQQGAVDCQYLVLAQECNVATRQGVYPVFRLRRWTVEVIQHHLPGAFVGDVFMDGFRKQV
jgi:hypothetical protein